MNLNASTHAFRRQAACLLLLAFACVQFVELTHQNEHTGLDAAERCVTCVQLDSSSVAQPSPGPAATADFGSLASVPTSLLKQATGLRRALPRKADLRIASEWRRF